MCYFVLEHVCRCSLFRNKANEHGCPSVGAGQRPTGRRDGSGCWFRSGQHAAVAGIDFATAGHAVLAAGSPAGNGHADGGHASWARHASAAADRARSDGDGDASSADGLHAALRPHAHAAAIAGRAACDALSPLRRHAAWPPARAAGLERLGQPARDALSCCARCGHQSGGMSLHCSFALVVYFRLCFQLQAWKLCFCVFYSSTHCIFLNLFKHFRIIDEEHFYLRYFIKSALHSIICTQLCQNKNFIILLQLSLITKSSKLQNASGTVILEQLECVTICIYPFKFPISDFELPYNVRITVNYFLQSLINLSAPINVIY